MIDTARMIQGRKHNVTDDTSFDTQCWDDGPRSARCARHRIRNRLGNRGADRDTSHRFGRSRSDATGHSHDGALFDLRDAWLIDVFD